MDIKNPLKPIEIDYTPRGNPDKFSKIVNDAIKGRYEVPAGIGEIIVCVGHKIEETGDFATGKKYVAVYSKDKY